MKRGLPGGRWALWLPLLALAAWLAWFGDKTPPARPVVPAPAPAVVAHPGTAARPGATPEPIEALLARVQLAPAQGRAAANLFANAPWRAAPPPAPAPPPARAVEAPAAVVLPNYRVLGKKLESERWEVYLGRDELSFIARVGETVEAVWRVERIEPPSMLLLHLPSGQAQSLPIGDAR